MKIAIAGYGVEGEANYRYWNTPEHEVIIVDETSTPSRPLPEGTHTKFGEDAFADLNGFDMVVRTAGLAPGRIVTDGKVWSSTNEFFARCPAPIIGVTGTKGKGTTSSLITSILRAAGRTVHLVGNIGTPPLDVLPQITESDVVVFELSSFQLWDIERSPQTAVVLLIEPDHLNVHPGMDNYVAAKANIRRFQKATDYCVYHPTNKYAQQIAQSNTSSQPVRYGVPDDGGVYVKDGYFKQNEQIICSTDELKLIGAHNVENACAALTVAKAYDASDEAIVRGLNQFTGLPHRLKFVREVGGVRYYDDSIATTPGSAIAALSAFDQPKLIILGGQSKGIQYDEVIVKCRDTYTQVIAIGEVGDEIMELCQQSDVTATRLTGNMASVVEKAHELAPAGSTVILSPATASFDMFTSYADRGDQFIAAVDRLVAS